MIGVTTSSDLAIADSSATDIEVTSTSTSTSTGIAADVKAATIIMAVRAAGLRLLSHGHWPDYPGDSVRPIPGFILSSFNPLVIEVAERCLRRHLGAPELSDPSRLARTALVLASASGDRATAQAITDAASANTRVPPLLFFQSNPNAVLGYITSRWALGGPVVSLSPIISGGLDPAAAGLACALSEAVLLLADGDADQVLVIAAEQAHNDTTSDNALATLVTHPVSTAPNIGTPTELPLPSDA